MSHVVSAPHTTGVPGQCLNCHQPLLGAFCHQCGQAASAPARITGHYLLHDLPHSVWHLDHGIIYSVREMLLRPGLSIRRYLAGERKRFFHPLSLLLLVGGVSAFLFGKLHIQLFNEPQPGMSPQLRQTQAQMMAIIQQYQSWISILFLPISASVATPLLRRATGYAWAEQLVAAALLSSTFATVGLLFIPLMAYWSGQAGFGYVAAVMTLTMIGYKAWGYAQLQAVTAGSARPVRRWVRGLFVAVAEYISTIILFGIALVAMFLLHR